MRDEIYNLKEDINISLRHVDDIRKDPDNKHVGRELSVIYTDLEKVISYISYIFYDL